MSEMFEDIEGVEVVVYDLLIWGENEEHNARLQQVLKWTQHRNLRLNKDKSQIKLEKNQIHWPHIEQRRFKTRPQED